MIRRALRYCSTRQMCEAISRKVNTFYRVIPLLYFHVPFLHFSNFSNYHFKNTMVLKERTMSILENGNGKINLFEKQSTKPNI